MGVIRILVVWEERIGLRRRGLEGLWCLLMIRWVDLVLQVGIGSLFDESGKNVCVCTIERGFGVLREVILSERYELESVASWEGKSWK